jgi:hypothetical protein
MIFINPYEFRRRLIYVALHGSLGFYLRVVLCMRAVPMLWHVSMFLMLRNVGVLSPYFFLFDWRFSLLFPVRNFSMVRYAIYLEVG